MNTVVVASSSHAASPPLERLGIAGNGQIIALVGADGDIAWCCWPRPDDAGPLTAPIHQLGADMLDATERYWTAWVRRLAIPYEWQAEVIRAAITLQLCCFEGLGLLSEQLDARTGRLWGNFPHTAAMPGIITTASRLSRDWDEAA